MLRDFTAVTAGDHIDWITTSPAAIRLTLSSKVDQKARNWPSFFSAIRASIVLSISSLVMLPLSPYFRSPRASSAIAASMIPIEGMLTSAVLPLNSGLNSSTQLLISRPTRSGRMPRVSALEIVGMAVARPVGAAANSVDSTLSVYSTFTGRVPWRAMSEPSKLLPSRISGVMSPHILIFVMSTGCRLPDL